MLPVRPILVPEADTSNRNCKVLLDGGFYERVIHFDYEQFCPLLLYIQTILFVLIVLCMFTLEPWLGSFKNADLRKVFVEIQLWEFCVYVRMKITGLCQSSIFLVYAAYPHNFTEHPVFRFVTGLSSAAIWLHFLRSWSTPATTLLQLTLKQTRKRKKRMTVMTGVVAWENICLIGAVACGFSLWSLLLCWCQKS